MNILENVESAPRATATEALYYCLRALKQAGLPNVSKKDYFSDTASSTPTPEGIALARTILSRIEEAEHADLDHIDEKVIFTYIHDVAQAMDALSKRVEGFSLERGAELLKQMRAS